MIFATAKNKILFSYRPYYMNPDQNFGPQLQYPVEGKKIHLRWQRSRQEYVKLTNIEVTYEKKGK